jgi:hypothetical protein
MLQVFMGYSNACYIIKILISKHFAFRITRKENRNGNFCKNSDLNNLRVGTLSLEVDK